MRHFAQACTLAPGKVHIILGNFFKVAYEIAATPVTYLIVNGLKRLEGVEVYDTDTNFNPFAAGPEPPPPGGVG